MATIGYARVSTVGQSLNVQVDKLKKYGCEKIYREKKSGTTANRPELTKCLDYVREGDVLVITKLDRLARSTLDLHQLLAKLTRKGVDFTVLDQSMDTTTKEGKLLFGILSTIAEFETELRKERQLEGIARAKKDGVQFGRKAKLTSEQIQSLRSKRAEGFLIKDLMKEYRLSKASVYRYLSE
jgi:DNA invertase Pin-like site-specific DNA recombinase